MTVSIGAYFIGQAIRCLRDNWGGGYLEKYAQEMYELLSNVPDNASGPVTVNFGPNNTPQVTPGSFLLDPLGNFSLPDLSLPGFNFNNPNDVQQTDNPQDQTPTSRNPTPSKPKQRSKSQVGYQRVTGPAQVISGGGSSYSAKFYPNGTGGDSKTVTVNQLQTGIDDLQPGDWLPVFQVIKYELKVTETVENPGRSNEKVIATSTQINILSTTYDAIASKSSGGQSSCIPGKVVSGSGSNYVVTVYPTGSLDSGENVNVLQLQIDPSETIPPGSWAIVAKNRAGYSMQIPVWLSDL